MLAQFNPTCKPDFNISALKVEFDCSSVPPNVQFVIDDIERPWAYSKPFDLIFSRQMLGAIPEMKSYVQKCYE
jgi:hypothetical protein